MNICILGRQPAIGIAELEQLYGSESVRWFSDISALVDDPGFDFEILGGTQKAGRVVAELHGNWRQASEQIVNAYSQAWSDHEGKITLGISAYGFDVATRDIQKTGLVLKARLKKHSVSLRLIPNSEAALNTATSHHNKLGLSTSKVELIVVRAGGGRIIVAESVGAQNITALAQRDQGRPKRDAFVGMLPPKLARIMVNLACGQGVDGKNTQITDTNLATLPTTNYQLPPTILDPFCGTGVVLQEALLLGYSVLGTDLSPKMVDYSVVNLEWLSTKYRLAGLTSDVQLGDAMTAHWPSPIDAVVTETYLGLPFSAPPSSDKLAEVRDNCDRIVTDFLRNLRPQIKPGTPVCLAVPAWRSVDGHFTHLPLIGELSRLGYAHIKLKNARPDQLLYYRENQVVARELLILARA